MSANRKANRNTKLPTRRTTPAQQYDVSLIVINGKLVIKSIGISLPIQCIHRLPWGVQQRPYQNFDGTCSACTNSCGRNRARRLGQTSSNVPGHEVVDTLPGGQRQQCMCPLHQPFWHTWLPFRTFRRKSPQSVQVVIHLLPSRALHRNHVHCNYDHWCLFQGQLFPIAVMAWFKRTWSISSMADMRPGVWRGEKPYVWLDCWYLTTNFPVYSTYNFTGIVVGLKRPLVHPVFIARSLR